MNQLENDDLYTDEQCNIKGYRLRDAVNQWDLRLVATFDKVKQRSIKLMPDTIKIIGLHPNNNEAKKIWLDPQCRLIINGFTRSITLENIPKTILDLLFQFIETNYYEFEIKSGSKYPVKNLEHLEWEELI